MKWNVQLKSRHNFVRPTINRSANAPINAFNTNDNITERPPESVTWISCNKTTLFVYYWILYCAYANANAGKHLHDIEINDLMCDLHRQTHPSQQLYILMSRTKCSGWPQSVQTIALGPIVCFWSPFSFSLFFSPKRVDVTYFVVVFKFASLQYCFSYRCSFLSLFTVHMFPFKSLNRFSLHYTWFSA